MKPMKNTSKNLSLLIILIALAVMVNVANATENKSNTCPETLNFNIEPLADDKSVDLCKEYLGKVVMIVNTASYCGFTPQYKSLEAIYRDYESRGFVILGFPSNDFGAQEPGNESTIKDFCERTYGVKFPMFEKTRVTESNADPLYRTLGSMAGEYPKWNFHKYILDREGKLVASIPSQVDPKSSQVVSIIEKLL